MFPLLCSAISKESLHQVQTFKLDQRVRIAAERLMDAELLAKLSEGDLVATETCYHSTCLTTLYNKVCANNSSKSENEKRNEILEGISIAQVVAYIRQCLQAGGKYVPVFQLKELKGLYTERLLAHRYPVAYEHSTCFKEKLIPELSEYKARREVILTFNKEIGTAIFDACDFQEDGVCLAKAASIIRKELINITKEADFNITKDPPLSKDKNIEAVSQPIYSFINMILNGS